MHVETQLQFPNTLFQFFFFKYYFNSSITFFMSKLVLKIYTFLIIRVQHVDLYCSDCSNIPSCACMTVVHFGESDTGVEIIFGESEQHRCWLCLNGDFPTGRKMGSGLRSKVASLCYLPKPTALDTERPTSICIFHITIRSFPPKLKLSAFIGILLSPSHWICWTWAEDLLETASLPQRGRVWSAYTLPSPHWWDFTWLIF